MAEKLNDLIAARTEKPAPAGADKIPLLDSADANKFRWLSWSGLLARLSALFDPAGTASAAVSTHLAAADPHPTYTTAAELASAISAKADASHTQAASTITDFSEAVDDRVAALLVAGTNVTLNYNDSAGTLTVASSGVSVHASLGGLASDDHPQYYNQARGDARYSQTSHSHAGVYEPAGAISTHAATAQVHGISAFGSTLVDDASATAARATLGLGTVATLNVGVAAGNIPQLDGSARLPAVDGSLLTGLATPAPRIVTVPAATGVVTADLANASRVVVKMTQTGPISAITPQNVPTVCDVRYEITQGAGGPWSLPQSAWAPAVASAYYVYPAGTTVFWWSTTDGGATATLECNAPLSLSLSQANAAGTIVVDAAGVGEVVVNLTLTGDITGITRQNIPTNCLIRYETTQGAGGPWVIKDSAWGSGASVDPYLTATTGKTVIVWSTADGGTTATVSGPAKGAISAAWVRRFGGIKMPAGRYYDQSLLAVGLTTLAGVAGRIDLVPWVPWYDQTVDRLGVNVTTAVAGALGRVVIYGANANDEPDSLLLLPGADLSLAAVAFVEHAQTFTFKRNTLYYIGFIHSSTATISGIQGYCLPNFGFSGNTSTSPGSVIRQTVTYPNAPANFGFIASSHFSASSGPSIKMRAA